MAFCTECGKEIANGIKFCPVCGAKQIPTAEPEAPKQSQENIPPIQQIYTPPVQEQPLQQSYTPPVQEQPVQQSYTPPVQEQPAQQSYTPPMQAQSAQQSYTPPVQAQPAQQSYTPPMQAQSAQQSYTPPVQEHAQQQSYTPPMQQSSTSGTATPKKPANMKLLLIIGGAVLVMIIALVLILTLSGNQNKEPQGPAKYIGVWTCTRVSVFGVETDTQGVLEGDFTLEILDTGRYKMEYDGSHNNSFWEADEENITVKSGSDKWTGTWQADGTLFFEDLFDIGVRMYFTKTSGGVAETTGDPLLGTWLCAQYAYQDQQPDDASSLFQKGCTVTFDAKQCKITAEDYEETVSWKQNGDSIELTGSSIFKGGFVLKNGKLSGEYGGSGVTLFFIKEGTATPTGTVAEGGFVGHWNGVDMILAGTSMGEMYGDSLASVLYLDINADGTASMCNMGTITNVTWTESADGLTLSTADGQLSVAYVDDQLSVKVSTEEGDIEYRFAKGEPAAAPAATVSPYTGYWESVECIGPDENGEDVALSTIYSAEELANMFSITLNPDGTANIFLVDTDNLGTWQENGSGITFTTEDGTEFEITDENGQLVFAMSGSNTVYYEQNAEKTAEIVASASSDGADANDGAPVFTNGVTFSYEYNNYIVTGQIPADTWSSKLQLAGDGLMLFSLPEAEIPKYASGYERISINIRSLPDTSVYDKYVKDSTDVKDIGALTIAGVEMQGRTYTRTEYDEPTTEYIGVIDGVSAISIRVCMLDFNRSDVQTILNSLQLESKYAK